MNLIDDIKLFELLAFCLERYYIFGVFFDKQLSQGFMLTVFAFTGFLYLACFVWRIFEKQPLIDNAFFSSKKNGGLFWIEKLVFWIERVSILFMSIYGISTWWSRLLLCDICTSCNLIYLLSFIDNFKLKKKDKMEQLNESDHVIDSCSTSEKIDENSHNVNDGNGEKMADDIYEEEEDNCDDSEDEYSDEGDTEELEDQEEEEEQPPKKKNRSEEGDIHEEEQPPEKMNKDEDKFDNDETMEDYSLTDQLYEDMQILKTDLDNLKEDWSSEMKRIKSEHEEQRRNWEQEKNDIAGKLCAATALSEVYQGLVREREESFRKLEEQKNDLAAKLCAATASSYLYQGLLHDLGY